MPLQQSDLMRFHKCEGDKTTQMQPLNSLSNPSASEFYCNLCHKSEAMPIEVATYFNQMQKKNMAEANRG